ncbi:MAG: glycoside hydrolase family 16 protein [Lentisphaeria bacterium]|nr:glycoside hydrolase family 16 protein [Lentisphaeria bacterium]
MQKFAVKDHEYSLLPEGKWNLVWSDEFDGTELDTTKWDYRLSMMGKRHPAWTDKAVHLDGKSNAVFSIIEENGLPVSSQLQTGYNFMDEPVQKTIFEKDDIQWNIGKLKESKFLHRYGYYECRCRLQQNPDAWWSAFWMQSPVIGSSLDPAESGSEIDIMECFEYGKLHEHNIFTGGYGLDNKKSTTGSHPKIDMSEFHRFGVLWDETGYTFYFDGVEDGRVTDYVSKRPQFILISTEVVGYRHKEHAPVQAAIDSIGKDDFLVDYIRVFDKVD